MNNNDNHSASASKENYINKTLDILFLRTLKISGFKATTQKALIAAREYFKKYIIEHMKIIKGVSQHALRNRISVVDIFNCVGVVKFDLESLSNGADHYSKHKDYADYKFKNSQFEFPKNDFSADDFGKSNFNRKNYDKHRDKEFQNDSDSKKLNNSHTSKDKILNDSLNDKESNDALKDKDLNNKNSNNDDLNIAYLKSKDENDILRTINDPKKSDEFFYVYEFMPPFPESHTYKKTFPKNKIDNQSKRIKLRRDQSLDVEDNLFLILKNRNEIKDFLNFMFQK